MARADRGERRANGGDVVDDRAHRGRRPDEPAARRAASSRSVLPEDAIVTADSGSSTNWYARQLKLRQGNLASLSGTLATMVPGVPYAIAAKFAHPEPPGDRFVGDGAFQMLGMNEMLTVKRYMERWHDKRLIFCVFNNQDLNQVTWEQRVMEGDPKFPGTQWLPNFDYADVRRALRPEGDLLRRRRRRCARPGRRRSPPTAPSCSRSRPTPRSRRCRRTSRRSRPRRWRRRWSRATPSASA